LKKTLENIVYSWRRITSIILEEKMIIPKKKNHCLRELIEEWKLYGPAVWAETSFKESKHAFFRSAIDISNNKNAEYFCAKLEYAHELYSFVLDGGTFTNGKKATHDLQDLLKLFNNFKPGWFPSINQQISNKTQNTTVWLTNKKLPHGLPFTAKKKINKDNWPLTVRHICTANTTNLTKVPIEELDCGAGSFAVLEINNLFINVDDVIYVNDQHLLVKAIYVLKNNKVIVSGVLMQVQPFPREILQKSTQRVIIDGALITACYVLRHNCNINCDLEAHHCTDYYGINKLFLK